MKNGVRSNKAIAEAMAKIVALIALALLLPFLVHGAYGLGILDIALVYCILVIGFNFSLGYTGLLSLGQVGFWALGAYSTALLTSRYHESFVFSVLAGVVVASLAAVVLAVLTMRLRSHYFALATLGFGEIIQIVLLNWKSFTGGADGIGSIASLGIGGYSVTSPLGEYWALTVVVAVLAVLAWLIETSRLGRQFRCIQSNRIGAESLGYDVRRIQLIAIVISAIYGAISGSLYASIESYVSPDTFSLSVMVLILTMLIVGGRGYVIGAIVGAIALGIISQRLDAITPYYNLIYGLLLLFLIAWMPDGVLGGIRSASRFLRSRRRGEHPEGAVL